MITSRCHWTWTLNLWICGEKSRKTALCACIYVMYWYRIVYRYFVVTIIVANDCRLCWSWTRQDRVRDRASNPRGRLFCNFVVTIGSEMVSSFSEFSRLDTFLSSNSVVESDCPVISCRNRMRHPDILFSHISTVLFICHFWLLCSFICETC